MFILWQATEVAIWEIIEQYFWLSDGGLSEQQAIKRIDAFHFRPAISTLKASPTLSEYIENRVAAEDPDYIALGPDILSETIGIAEAWAKAKIRRKKTDRPYPPAEWLKTRVGTSQIDQEQSLPFKDGGIVMVTDGLEEMLGTTVPLDTDWQRIKLRMVLGDELWTFSSPSEYWQGLAGRMGVALIRNGRPIGHVITMMN